MYEIKKNLRNIDGVNFVTYGRNIKDAQCEIQVEAGTTGDFGRNNAKTYFRITNVRGAKFRINQLGLDGFEIVMDGNTGFNCFIIGLKFIRKAIIDILAGKNY